MPEEMKLKSCPFCGGNDVISHKGSRQRMCMKCGAEGPEAKSRNDSDGLWNRRTPEPGTSIIHWNRYDGTTETLPGAVRRCLVVHPASSRVNVLFISPIDRATWVNTEDSVFKKKIQIGDQWAYLPTPEGMP